VSSKRNVLSYFSARLTQPLALEDGRAPGILRSTIYAISAFVIAVVVWASLTDVRELTIAPGQIIPRGQIQAVQHLEGGIVAEILVHEGGLVTAGQPLVRLEPAAAASDRKQLESRRAGLRLQLIRLAAESQGLVPEFGPLAIEYPSLATGQVELYGVDILHRRKEREMLTARIRQRRSEFSGIQSDLETARAQLDVQNDQFKIQTDLVKLGYTAGKTFLEAKFNMQRSAGDVTNLEGKLKTASEAIAEAEGSLAEADSNAARKIAEERAKAESDLAETEQQLAKVADRFDRLFVRAPSDGVIQEMIPKSPGEVIKPGDLVARVVPSGYELVAEVRIESKDAGHVKAGTHADLKFSTFDSAVYGTIPGVVEYVSATTFTPTPGQALAGGQTSPEPYFKALIRPSNSYIGMQAFKRPITPGMTLQANIVTGSRSIVRYMFKPIFNALDVAFSER
jgi:adhesin transport system membrane fusion protein